MVSQQEVERCLGAISSEPFFYTKINDLDQFLIVAAVFGAFIAVFMILSGLLFSNVGHQNSGDNYTFQIVAGIILLTSAVFICVRHSKIMSKLQAKSDKEKEQLNCAIKNLNAEFEGKKVRWTIEETYYRYATLELDYMIEFM